MAKTKKITATSIFDAIGVKERNSDKLIIGEGENQIEIAVRKKLSLTRRADMVNSIVNMVWYQDEDGNDVLAPYLRKFAYEFNILNYFTNIALPDDMEKVWDLIDNTDIAGAVMDFVGHGYIENIIREANEAIEYRKSENLKRSKIDTILTSLGGIVKSVGQETENLDAGGIIGLVERFAPELKDKFKNIVQEQMANATNESVSLSEDAK
jgi:hypothetical protein